MGIINLSELGWDEAIEVLEIFINDGWEVLAIKVLPDGVWAFVQERMLDWLDEKI